jgi:hypothetical protein
LILPFAVFCWAGVAQQPEGPLTEYVSDAKGDFRVLARAGGTPSFSGAGSKTTFELNGSPVVQNNSSGFQLEADKIYGTYSTAEDKSIQIDSAKAEGHAVASFDSQRAAKFNQPKGGVPSSEISVLSSANLSITQKDHIATAVVDSSFTLVSSSQGLLKQGYTSSHQTMTASSGTFDFTVPKKPGRAKLQTGEAKGPVYFHRTEVVDRPCRMILFAVPVRFTVPVTREFDATGDHLTVDMSKKSDQIALQGHVHWSYTEDGLHGITDLVTATLDDDGNVVSYQTTGVPGLPAGGPAHG